MASLLNRIWSGSDFWDEEENKKQREQFARQAKQSQSPVQVSPKPRQQVRAVEPKQSPYRRTGVNTSITNLLSPTAQTQQATPLDKAVNDSYGGGFTGIKNRVRDVFDANTEADYLKRQAQSGLRETSQQKDDRLTKKAVSSQGNRNSANQFSGAGLKNIADRVGKAPGSIMQVQGRVAKTVNDIDNPLLRTGAKALTIPFGGLMTTKQANDNIRHGQNINKFVDNKLQQSSLGDRAGDNRWARMGGQLTTDLPLQIATGGAGLVNTGVQMSADEANKAERAGRTNAQATGIGLVQGGASALSEKFGIDRFLPGSGGGNLVTNAVKRFGTEGLQEAQQQFAQNLIANKAYDPNQGLVEGVPESFVLGGVAGGAMSGMVDYANKPPSPASNPVIEQARQRVSQPHEGEKAILSDLQEALLGKVDPRVLNQVHRAARGVADRHGLDITSGSVVDINQRINDFIEGKTPEVAPQMSAIQRAREAVAGRLTPLNEGGYVQIPGNADPVVNQKTGETLSQTVEKLQKLGWSNKDIQGYKNAVLGKSKPKVDDPNVLDTVNPTGGLFVDYDPESRMRMKLADNITTLDKTMGGNPDDMVTVYRGAPANQKKINPGDFVTTSRELAASYTGDGNILEQQVRKSDVLDDSNEPLGDEYLYRPQKKSLKDKLGIKPLNEVGAIGRDVRPDQDPLESLRQEARKYKSAEEFVKAQSGNQGIYDSAYEKMILKNRLEATPFNYDLMKNTLGTVPETKGGMVKVYRATTNGKILPGDNVSIYDVKPYINTPGLNATAAKMGITKLNNRNDVKVVEEWIPKADLYQTPAGTQVYAPNGTKSLTDLYNQATQSQPPKSTPERVQKVAEHAKQKAREVYEQTGDVKKAKEVHNKVIDKARELKKSKGVILADGVTTGGKKVQKVLRGPGQSSIDTVQQDVQKGMNAQNDAIADALGIPLEQRVPTTKDMSGIEKIVRTAENETMQDVFDQRDYGVKDIQNAPTNTFSGLFGKYLDVRELSDAELSQSNRTGVRAARDTVGKLNPLRAVDKGVGKGLEKLSRGGRVARAINRTAQYINKNAGQDPAMVEATKRLAGSGTHTDAMLVELGKKAYDLVPNAGSRERVHAILDTEASGGKLKYKDLTKQEQQAADMLRDIGDTINDASFRAKMITRKKWESNRGGRYIARMYSEINQAEDVTDLLDIPDSRGLFLGMYKSRVELNDALRTKLIKDPVKLAVIRARQVRSNEALSEFMNTADKAGYVKSKPTDGFVKVAQEPGQRMHNWNGKYVRQDVYESVNGYKAMNQMANGLNNILDIYDGNPVRRLRKKMLTIYNPVVRTGNITSNYFFAYLNGVNPVTYQKNKIWAKKAIKNNDQLVIEARRSGLIGSDIVSRDKNMFDSSKEFMRDINKLDSQKLGEKIKSADDTISNRYGKADDLAKLSALKTHIDRGYSIKQAIEKTSRGFQDYSRVGHMYDMAAKSPVFGNAFIRFQGDLYTNILKNAAVDHPVRLASLPFATLIAGSLLSAMSGETEEDKKTREDRLGAPKIPFTDISTEFQTPWGAVDVARFTPLYMRNVLTDGESGGGKNKMADDISRLAPFNIPGANTKGEWARSVASDPLIGPIISMLTDTEWRGKSVKDPDGYRDGKALFPDDKLPSGEEWRNRGQYAVRSYAPYPFNEIGDIAASFNQNKRNEQTAPGTKNDPANPDATVLGREGFNTSGSKKTVGQSVARLGGVRAQQFGKEEAQEQRERNDMFKFFGEIDKWKKDLPENIRNAFESRHKSNATRSGIKKEFAEDPWYKYKNAGELLQNPQLFDAEKQYAIKQNAYDGRPIDPIYNLPEEQRNLVLAKKLKMPGAKDEGFNKLYDQEWYQNFRKEQDKYYAAKDKYKEKLGFADIKETNPYPEADPKVQKDMDYYFSLPAGGQRTAFRKNNPGVWSAITGQWDKQNAWTDAERARLGLPAIDREDDKKFSSGSRGGRRGGSKSAVDIPNLSKLISGTSALSKLVASTGDDLKVKQTAYKNLLKAGTSKKQKKQLAKASSRKGKA